MLISIVLLSGNTEIEKIMLIYKDNAYYYFKTFTWTIANKWLNLEISLFWCWLLSYYTPFNAILSFFLLFVHFVECPKASESFATMNTIITIFCNCKWFQKICIPTPWPHGGSLEIPRRKGVLQKFLDKRLTDHDR